MLPVGDGWNGWVRYHPSYSAKRKARMDHGPLQRLVARVLLLRTQLDPPSRDDKYHSGGLNNTVVFWLSV